MFPPRPPAPLEALGCSRPGAQPPVHPTSAIRHRRRLTTGAPPRARPAPRRRLEVYGLHRLFLNRPPAPPAPLQAPRDDGLAALADGDVLDDDGLLAAGFKPLHCHAPLL